MMELKYDRQLKDTSMWNNVRVEHNGSIISSVLSQVETSYYREIVSWETEIEYDIRPFFEGRLLLFTVHGNAGLINGMNAKLPQTFLWLYDDKAPLVHTDIGDIWPFLQLPAVSFVFQEALFLAGNPCTFHTDMDWADTTSTDRWLFPHKDGSRAAFEHLRKTSLVDDFHRLSPHLKSNPRVAQTFEKL